MKNRILVSEKALTLVGGGHVGPNDLTEAFVYAPTAVAADGGADAAWAAGIDLAAVIGDMDSISDGARAQIPPDRLHHIAEQDSTDFDKALRHISASVIVAVGFAGGRIDHQLAAFHTMIRHADRAIILLSAQDVVFVCPPSFALDLGVGTRVSLFPMGLVTGQSVGLEWQINDLEFAPGTRSGTSNRALGPISVQMSDPMMLCLLPRDCLAKVVSLFKALPEPARWPVRVAPRKVRQPS